MTEVRQTPEILSINEQDLDGNVWSVNYYREDLVKDFLNSIQKASNNLREKAKSKYLRDKDKDEAVQS